METSLSFTQEFGLWLRRSFGDDVWDDSAGETAERFFAYLDEYRPQPIDFTFTTFRKKKAQLIIVKDIEFASICCHHLLPFFGRVHIGYISAKVEVGVSKIPRLVDWVAHRPQTQERMTSQLVDELDMRLEPQGVMVVVNSIHTCMSCRGVRKVGASMVTSLPKGQFLTSPPARQEFLELIR